MSPRVDYLAMGHRPRRRKARPRLTWNGRARRAEGMTLERALEWADSMKATRLARGGKAGEHHYDLHRAMERLAREIRARRRA